MFGFLKRKRPQLAPDEPIELKTSIEIDRPPSAIYPLLDFADERNQMRVRGNVVKPVGSDPNAFRLWYDKAPDLNFLFTVTEAIPDRSYAFDATIVPPVGRRLGTNEAYALEPLDDGRCTVTFVNTIRHRPGLTQEELADEIAKSSLAAANALTKLRLLAEEGVAAVQAFERELGQR